MPLPLLTEYSRAVQNKKMFNTQKELTPVIRNDEPYIAAGAFGCVFKMRHSSGSHHAIKCFTKYVPHKQTRMEAIALRLQHVQSPYIVHYRYLPEELWVNSYEIKFYDVLLMEWVEGKTLGEAVREHATAGNRAALQQLAANFIEMGQWLLAQDFAHGDLKHDNILVRPDGSLALIDYDGMYVPALQGYTAENKGVEEYQHPLRTLQDFNAQIDDYSIAVIAAALLALAEQPDLYTQYGNADRLLFSRTDLTTTSPLLKTLRQLSHPTINQLLTLLQESIVAQTLQLPGLTQALQTPTLHLPPTIAETQNLIAIKKQEIVLLENHLQTLQYRTAPKVAPPPLNKIIETVNNINLHLIRVEGGTFNMGGQDNEVTKDEEPVHRVTLDTFYIGIYPVTQAQYRVIMGYNPSYHFGDSRPVENVSWKDAVEFCHRLSDLTGKTYRLPTEAEWEYAARGGNKSRNYKYAGSNNLGNVAWYTTNSGFTTHAVGRKSPNELGLYDMSGNVWEWCWDWFDSGYYKVSPAVNPRGPASGTLRVLRGGGWSGDAQYCRVSFRSRNAPGNRSHNYGFRLVVFP